MILDIRYHNRAPEQIQQVRRVSHYNDDGIRNAELIIYTLRENRYIPLADIREVIYTND